MMKTTTVESWATIFIVALVLSLSVFSTSSNGGIVVSALEYNVSVIPSITGSYTAGQEIRVRVVTSDTINISTTKFGMRIIAAYANRGSSGLVVRCNASNVDVWQESTSLGRRYFNSSCDVSSTCSPGWVVTEAFSTFTVPTFPWRLCFADFNRSTVTTAGYNHYLEVNGLSKYKVFGFDSSPNLYFISSTMAAGDFATIAIKTNFTRTIPAPLIPFEGDNVKLVPAGYACTYEKTQSRDLALNSSSQYCGSAAIYSNGTWLNEMCIREGSVQGGVAHLGTNLLNPYLHNINTTQLGSTDMMVAYVQLPATAGDYDICYSPLTYRTMRTGDAQASAPMWFKLFRAQLTDCPFTYTDTFDSTTCAARTTKFTVTTATSHGLSWSILDETRLSWGSIRIDGTGLSSEGAGIWDCVNCTTLEYFNTAGGDTFRLVPLSQFSDPEPASSALSSLYLTNGLPAVEYKKSTDSFYTRYGAADYGSPGRLPGCWYNAEDNYGSRGSTVSSATDTLNGDTDTAGPTASGNLGGDPRMSSTSWDSNTTGQSSVWAYVRIPSSGTYVVCYRKGGINNWRALPWNTAKTPTTHAQTLTPQPQSVYAHIRAFMNDTRRSTWGEVVIKAPSAVLHTRPSNFFDTTVALSNVFSIALRVVKSTESCEIDVAPAKAESWDPGAVECYPHQCGYANSCSGQLSCYGSADNLDALRSEISFHILVPSTNDTYRFCLKYSYLNWFQAGEFTPTDPPTLRFTLSDLTEDSWAALRFQHSSLTKYYRLDSRPHSTFTQGDMARLVPRTDFYGNELHCDLTWNPSSDQRFMAVYSSVDLGAYCYMEGSCLTAATNPFSLGVFGKYPYNEYITPNDILLDANIGTVGFMHLPKRLWDGFNVTSYKVCYKQRYLNWVEVPSMDNESITTFTPITRTACYVPPATLYSGEYVGFDVSCVAEFPLASALLKLVSSSKNCEAEAAGTANYGMTYASFTNANTVGSYLVNNTYPYELSTSNATSAKAFLTLPVNSQLTDETYKLCFMDLTANTTNWLLTAFVPIKHTKVTYTAPGTIYHRQQIKIEINSPNAIINATPEGDFVKVVPFSSPCFGIGDLFPNISTNPVTSYHTFQNWSVSNTTDGIPLHRLTHDRSYSATFEVNLPSTTGSACYKVCYRPYGMRWRELNPSNGNNLCAVEAPVASVAFSSEIFVTRSFFPGINSTGVKGIISGAASSWVYDVSSYFSRDLSTYTASRFFLHAVGTVGNDKFKMVKAKAVRDGLLEETGYTCLNSPSDTASMVSPNNAIHFDFPLEPGLYFPCYYVAAAGAWVNVSMVNQTDNVTAVDLTTTDGYIAIFPSNLTYQVDATKGIVTVHDDNTAVFNNYHGCAAALTDLDVVYFTTPDGVCGVSKSFHTTLNDAVSNSGKLNGAPNSTSFLARRSTTANLTRTPGVSGTYKLCFFRNNDERVNASSSVVATVPRNRWYHLLYYGRMPYYTYGTPTQIRILSCPSTIQNGKFVDISASFAYADGSAAYPPMKTQVLIRPGIGSFTIMDAMHPCEWRGANIPRASMLLSSISTLRYTTVPQVTFRVIVGSTCPDGLCSFAIAAPELNLVSPMCNITNSAATPVALVVTGFPTRCREGHPCNFRVIALDSNRAVAYPATGKITVSISVPDGGISFDYAENGVDLVEGEANIMTHFNFTAAASSWATGETVTFTFTESTTGITTQATIIIEKPILSSIKVQDIIPVDGLGNAMLNIEVPTWEPTVQAASEQPWFRPGEIVSSLTQDGHYLVAGQYYKLVLDASDQNDLPISSVFLGNQIDLLLTSTLGTTTGNVIFGAPPNAAANTRHYAVPFQTKSMAHHSFELIFRLKNSIGCRIADGGCTLSVLVNKKLLNGGTNISSYWRNRATKLRVLCGHDANTATSETCPESNVENGVYIIAEAVDANGVRDEYFDGIISSFTPPSSSTDMPEQRQPPAVTTVHLLSTQDTTVPLPPMQMQRGFMSVAGLTLSRPCIDGCSVLFVSNWGISAQEISLILKPTTTQLRCALSTPLYYFNGTKYLMDTPSTDLNLLTTTGNEMLLYTDTQLCFTVWAANAAGNQTLHETNWAYFSVHTESNVPVTAVEAGGRPRIQPMKNSRARFCFVASGTAGATYSVHFGVQRFGVDALGKNYWANSNGYCSLSGFKIRGTKEPARLAIAAFSGGFFTEYPDAQYRAPTSSLWLYSQHPSVESAASGTYALSTTLQVQDHYSNVIHPMEFPTSLAGSYVGIDRCLASHLGSPSTCATGSGTTANGTIQVTPMFSAVESGVMVVSLVEKSVYVSSSNLFYTFHVKKFCISCTLTFTVRIPGTDAPVNTFGQPIMASIRLSTFLPTSATSIVAFRTGTSPVKTNAWPRRTLTIGNAAPLLFNDICLVPGSSCATTTEDVYLTALDDERKNTSTINNNGKDIEVYVLLTTASNVSAIRNGGEPICAGDGNCNTAINSMTQVDILSSYEIGVSIGAQKLRCVNGTRCSDDGTTKVKQSLISLGNCGTISLSCNPIVTALQAISTTGTLPAAKFQLQGALSSSAYNTMYSRVATTGVNWMKGAMSLSAQILNLASSTPAIPVDLGEYGSFVWRGSDLAAYISVLPTARSEDNLFPPLRPSGSFPRYDGYIHMVPVSHLNISYGLQSNTTLPTGIPLPFTAEILDDKFNKASAADGWITVALYDWEGCHKGGIITVEGGNTRAVVSGRATFWITFSESCTNCTLEFKVTPSTAFVYDRMRWNPAALTTRSKMFNVVFRTAQAIMVHAIDDPATVPAEITTSTRLTVHLQTFGSYDGLSYPATWATGKVTLYPLVQPRRYMLWEGSGGVLVNPNDVKTGKHGVTTTLTNGIATIEFQFERPCAQCGVAVVWEIEGPPGTVNPRGMFPLLNNAGGSVFKVISESSEKALISPPRSAQKGKYFAFALWHVGQGAGVGRATLPPSPTPSMNSQQGINGDGGRIEIFPVSMKDTAQPQTEIWVFHATASCIDCIVRLHTWTLPMLITTPATHLRIITATPWLVGPSESTTISVFASDDDGFVDITAGGPSNCDFYDTFACNIPNAVLSLDASADGVTAGGFFPILSYLHTGGLDAGFIVTLNNNLLVDGIGNLSAQFARPVRGMKPLISLISRGIDSGKSKRKPTIDVHYGTKNLEASAEKANYNHNSLQELTVTVGLVNTFPGSAYKYVAAAVNSTFVLSFTPSCKRNRTTIPVERGLSKYTSIFEATPAADPCRIRFTFVPASPQHTCLTTTSCSTEVALTISDPPIVGWAWARPGELDDGAGLTGPRYAVAGRRSFLELHAVAQLDGKYLRTRSCPGCTVKTTLSNCPYPPTGVAATLAFATGSPSVQQTLLWPVNSVGYTCRITVALTRNGVNIPYVNHSSYSTWAYDVNVCVPHRLRLLTNITEHADQWDRLPTGVAHSVTLGIVDKSGNICYGDSQDDATTIAVSVPAQLSAVQVRVLNLNTTQSTTDYVQPPENTVMNTVRLMNGQFTFSLIFTASSRDAANGMVRVRFEGKSPVPALDMVAYTEPFATVVKATRLRIRPDTLFSSYLVSNRVVRTFTGTRIIGQAVDDLLLEWQKYAPNIPNVAIHPDEFGHDASIQWIVDPLPLLSSFPLRFSLGTRVSNLVNGESIVSFNFTGADGTYDLFLDDRNDGLRSSTPLSVTFQAITGLAYYFAPSETLCVQSPCLLVLPEFNTTASSTGNYNSIGQNDRFTLQAAVRAADGRIVKGDQESVLALRIRKRRDSIVTVDLANYSSEAERGPFFATVKNGIASWDVKFVGTTMLNVTHHEPIELEIFCPRLTHMVNPCLELNLPVIRTRPIEVVENLKTTDIDLLLTKLVPVVQFRMTIASLELFNSTRFRMLMLGLLQTAPNTQWPPAPSAQSITKIPLTTCEVDNSIFQGKQLSLFVCGAEGKCTTPYDFSCPNGVRICNCPTSTQVVTTSAPVVPTTTSQPVTNATSSNTTTQRRLQQLPQITTTPLQLQAELTFNMDQEDVTITRFGRFAGYVNVASMYAFIASYSVWALKTNETLAEFNIDPDSVALLTGNSAGSNTDATTTVPPSSTAELTTPEPTISTSGTSSNVFASSSLSLLVATLIVVISMNF